MVIVYHPGYYPGSTSPVADDVVGILDGPASTCESLSRDFAKEVGYHEVARFGSRDEADVYIRRNGLRVL